MELPEIVSIIIAKAPIKLRDSSINVKIILTYIFKYKKIYRFEGLSFLMLSRPFLPAQQQPSYLVLALHLSCILRPFVKRHITAENIYLLTNLTQINF